MEIFIGSFMQLADFFTVKETLILMELIFETFENPVISKIKIPKHIKCLIQWHFIDIRRSKILFLNA